MVSLVYGTRPGLLESGLASTRGHIDACTTRQCRTSVCMYAIAGAVDTIGPYHVVLIYDACVLSRRCDWVDDMQFFAHTYVPPHEIRRRGWKGGGEDLPLLLSQAGLDVAVYFIHRRASFCLIWVRAAWPHRMGGVDGTGLASLKLTSGLHRAQSLVAANRLTSRTPRHVRSSLHIHNYVDS